MYTRQFITVLMALLLCVMGADAKKSRVQKIYIFGMAASFTDTIVHFTPIQEVDSAWMDRKGKFLLGREEYSYQLRDYLAAQLEMPRRTCLVVYGVKRKKVEKKYSRMMRLYTSPAKEARHYDVRHIENADFRFLAVDMSATIEQRDNEAAMAEARLKEAGKPAKKADKKDKKKDKKKPKKAGKGGMPVA